MSGKEYRKITNKKECEESGKVWVNAHRRGGNLIYGYCRDQVKIDKTEDIHDRKEKELKDMDGNLEGYYQGKGSDPLEAINDILHSMEYDDSGEIEYEIDDNDTMDEKEVEKHGDAMFDVTIEKDGKTYSLSGIVNKENGRWIAGGEVEEEEY
jgi:hypothetical protein